MLCIAACAMSDDMLLHFSSNSSNQSDQSLPTKMAKLEARMVGKTSSTQQPAQLQLTRTSVSSAVKFVASENLIEPATSSDSDDGVSSFNILCATCIHPASFLYLEN